MAFRHGGRWRWLAVFLCLTVLSPGLGAAPVEESSDAGPAPRILLVGDSWAWFMFLNRSFDRALADRGLEEIGVAGFHTTVPGSTARQWTQETHLEQLRKVLEAEPSISIVHLSLGGNDFLNNWRPDWTEEQCNALFERVVNDIEVVVKACLEVRPDVHVAIINYDYINKVRSGGTLQDLNRAGMILSGMKRDLAQRTERCEFIHNYGLMQYRFGFPGAFPAGSVPYPGNAPEFAPWPGGDDNYGSPPEAMMDDIHLSPAGYRYLADHCLDTLYLRWLGLGEPSEARHAAAKN